MILVLSRLEILFIEFFHLFSSNYALEIQLRQYKINCLQLKKPITINSKQKPIALPTSDYRGNTIGVVSGWGRIGYNSKALALRKLETRLVNREECALRFMGRLLIYSTQVCSLVRGAGSCMVSKFASYIKNNWDGILTSSNNSCSIFKGDSGGPLITKDTKELVGIVSGGIDCASGYPDIFTGVYHYLDFIEDCKKVE